MNTKKMEIKNKKAYFDYEILDTYEAGIRLLGWEVKSLRKGRGQLKGAFCIITKDLEVFVRWIHISPWGTNPDICDSNRERKIFLHKKTIITLQSKLHGSSLALIPLKIYLKWSLMKISVGLAQGRKKHDKREVLKRRSMDKEIRKGRIF